MLRVGGMSMVFRLDASMHCIEFKWWDELHSEPLVFRTWSKSFNCPSTERRFELKERRE